MNHHAAKYEVLVTFRFKLLIRNRICVSIQGSGPSDLGGRPSHNQGPVSTSMQGIFILSMIHQGCYVLGTMIGPRNLVPQMEHVNKCKHMTWLPNSFSRAQNLYFGFCCCLFWGFVFIFVLRHNLSLCILGWPWAHYVVLGDFELTAMLLLQPTKRWNY